jgi:hypothetical protein
MNRLGRGSPSIDGVDQRRRVGAERRGGRAGPFCGRIYPIQGGADFGQSAGFAGQAIADRGHRSLIAGHQIHSVVRCHERVFLNLSHGFPSPRVMRTWPKIELFAIGNSRVELGQRALLHLVRLPIAACHRPGLSGKSAEVLGKLADSLLPQRDELGERIRQVVVPHDLAGQQRRVDGVGRCR